MERLRDETASAQVPLIEPPRVEELRQLTQVALSVAPFAESYGIRNGIASVWGSTPVPQAISCIHVYPDGGAREDLIGWGFVAVAHTVGQKFFVLGATGGRVISDPTHALWCGEAPRDN